MNLVLICVTVLCCHSKQLEENNQCNLSYKKFSLYKKNIVFLPIKVYLRALYDYLFAFTIKKKELKTYFMNLLVVVTQIKSMPDKIHSYCKTNSRGHLHSCKAIKTCAPKLNKNDIVTKACTVISHGGNSHSLIT